MSLPRPALLETIVARQSFLRRHRPGEPVNRSSAYIRTDNSMEFSENAVYESSEQRRPSLRPIDQRWDRSRGIVFGHTTQSNALRDHRWSRGDGVVFMYIPAIERGYANRKLPLSTGNTQQPPYHPQSSRQSSEDQGRGAVRGINSLVNENEKLKAEREALDSRLQAARAEIVANERLLATIQDRKGKLNAGELALEQDRKRIERAARENQTRVQQRGDLLEAKERALQIKEDEIESEIAAAKEQAKKLAREEVEALRVAVEQELSDAVDATKESHQSIDDQRQALDDRGEKLVSYYAAKFQQYEDLMEKRHKEDTRESKEAGRFREEVQRSHYQSYRDVWDTHFYEASVVLKILRETHKFLLAKANSWEVAGKDFRGEKIDEWFPHRYPSLNKHLMEYHETSFQKAKAEAQFVEDTIHAFWEILQDLRLAGHLTRALSRPLRFQENLNKYDVTLLVEDVLYSSPMGDLRSDLETVREEFRSQMVNTTISTERDVLQRKIKALNLQRDMASRNQEWLRHVRQGRAAKAMLNDSVIEKEIFVLTKASRDRIQGSRKEWKGASDGRGERTAKMVQDNADYVEANRTAMDELDRVLIHARQLRLLRRSLGLQEADEGQFDAAIEEEVDSEAELRDKAFESLVKTCAERGLVGSPSSFFRSPAAPKNVAPVAAVVPRISSSTKIEREKLQSRLRDLNVQLKRTSLTAEEKVKLKREMQPLKASAQLIQLRTVTANLENLQQRNPGDHAKVQNLERDIRVLNKALGLVEPPVDSSTPPSQHDPGVRTGIPLQTERRGGRLRPLRVRKTQPLVFRKLPAAKSVHTAARSESMSTVSSVIKKPLPIGIGPNFTASFVQQASHSVWNSNLRQFHTEGVNAAHEAAASALMSPYNESHDQVPDLMPLSDPPLSTLCSSPRSRGKGKQTDNAMSSSASSSLSQNSSQRSFETLADSEKSYEPSGGDDNSAFQPESVHSLAGPLEPDGSSKAIATAQADETTPVEENIEDPETDTDLSYHIPKEDYRSAYLASRTTDAAFWKFNLYKNADKKAPVNYYCTTFDQAEQRAKEFLNEPVIGFDIEWEIGASIGKSSIKHNVSLIQIAAEDKIALFHIALFKEETAEKLMPPSLRTILESRDVAKTGVNISGDARRLKECLCVDMAGLFELSHLYRVVMFSEGTPQMVNRKLFSLADQVQNVLLLPLKKDAVRTSAWSKRLRHEQSLYAASDAYAGFRLYHALEAKRKKMSPMPPRPAFWEEHKPIVLGNGQMVVAKPVVRKKKSPAAAADVLDEENEEGEEYFDAVENFEADQLDAQQDASQDGGIVADIVPSSPPLLGTDTQGDLTFTTPPASNSAHAEPTVSSEQEIASELSKPPSKRGHPPPSVAISLAESWVATFRSNLPAEYNLRAKHADLRAYALWHEQKLEPKQIASLLREPPLSLQTVASYVMQAVQGENLPADGDRLREVLGLLPGSVRAGVYGRIVERLGK